ncbi:hypothetical protein H5410_046658 [Solanum commersonii]|uniref:Uncharacterized protein n=1 Tax=Solanum commersonii TaxID=4109 RepID=A0A9J5XH22_SOLCO|nr:hypothetical protein H5410_046658 [Solanum commersonii]
MFIMCLSYHSWGEIRNNICQTMFNEFKCTWEPRYNMVNATTFERRASTRLSSWLKKVWDSDRYSTLMLSHDVEELHHY